MRGLYLHIPFCAKKCSYCDFYSFAQSETEYDKYVTALCDEFISHKARFSASFDTLYIGGGTPSVIGGKRLKRIIDFVKPSLIDGAEITVECNPADDLADTFKILKTAGVNRISLGVQSAVDSELKILGRRHTNEQVEKTVRDLTDAGFDNFSLDLMLGLPGQTVESLNTSLDFLTSFSPAHISCYILKLEENTPLFKNRNEYTFPDEDAVAEMYLYMCKYLKEKGFSHYEISNFAKPEYHSRHNTLYWNCEEYLGLGPSAHSFLNGKRFYYGRDYSLFLENPTVIDDGIGGDENEYIMLRLRLKEGISFKDFENRYGHKFPEKAIKNARRLQPHGLCNVTENGISLTEQGFLLSNSIILKLTEV